jgi:creatinine amidohydrolase
MGNLMNNSRFHRLDHITLKQLRALDRSRTVVLIPVGMLEEHGEHLPLGTDSFGAEGIALAAIAWLLENDPGLHAVLMPCIPYGTDPVDRQRPDLFEKSGSVWIRREALKMIVSDIAGHMVRYGFRNIFPIGFHGGADQSIALDEVCAEMRGQTNGLVMFEPLGYVLAGAEREMTPGLATLLGRPLTTKEEVSLKGSIHASMFETSMMLSIDPELVDPMYKRLRTIEWHEMFDMPDWPGYVGAGPAHADAAVGGAVLRWRGVRCGSLIHRAMKGENLTQLVRHPKWLNPEQGAEDISEDLAEKQAEPREVTVDSKPVMILPARPGLRPDPESDSPAVSSDDPNATPPSTMLETKPKLPRLRDSDQP